MKVMILSVVFASALTFAAGSAVVAPQPVINPQSTVFGRRSPFAGHRRS